MIVNFFRSGMMGSSNLLINYKRMTRKKVVFIKYKGKKVVFIKYKGKKVVFILRCLFRMNSFSNIRESLFHDRLCLAKRESLLTTFT